jgi:hypothetical protein
MKKIFKEIDIMGISPKLYYKNHLKHKSVFGGIISFIFYSIVMFLLTYFLSIFFFRHNFTIYENVEKKKLLTKMWSNDEFSIIVLDKYFNNIEDHERIYEIYADIWTDSREVSVNGTIQSKTIINKLDLEKCNISKFKNKDLWKDEKLINESYCFTSDLNNTKLNTTGTYGETGYTGIVIWIKLCTNNTNKTDCYPLEYSKKILENVFVYIKFLDFYFDNEKSNNNAISYIYSELVQSSSSAYKRQWYLFQKIHYNYDNGYLLSVYYKKTYDSLSSSYNSIDLRTNTTIENSFFVVSLNMNGSERIINKKFYKFQDLCADLGGIFNALWLFCLAVNYMFSYHKMYENIINRNINNYYLKEYNFKKDINTKTQILLNKNKLLSNNKMININNNNLKKSKSNFILDNTNTESNNEKKKLKITMLNKLKKNYDLFKFNNTSFNSSFSNLYQKNKTFIKNKKIFSLFLLNLQKKQRLKIPLLQKTNPFFFFCYFKYYNHPNKNISYFALISSIIRKQLDIENILLITNIIDKLELSLIKNPINYRYLENCYNYKVNLYNIYRHMNVNSNGELNKQEFYENYQNLPEECNYLRAIIKDEMKSLIT